MEYKTFCDQPIIIADNVVYLKNLRTGSSTTRKVKCMGKVKAINKSGIKIECVYCEDSSAKTGDIHVFRSSEDIICVIGRMVYRIRRNDSNVE